MTNEINTIGGGAAIISSLSSSSSSLSSNAELTKKTKTALEALNVDTKNIKTESDGKAALIAAQKKLEMTQSQTATASTTSSNLTDEAAVYESSTESSK